MNKPANQEWEIQDQASNFYTIFDTMEDIILVGNGKGEVIYANRATINKLGYTMEELKTMHVIELNPLEKREEAEEIFGDMLVGKAPS